MIYPLALIFFHPVTAVRCSDCQFRRSIVMISSTYFGEYSGGKYLR
jgi:hypothetical protein